MNDERDRDTTQQRVEDARSAFRAATDEASRGAAVAREVRAQLDAFVYAAELARTPPALRAARVQLGALSARDAVREVRALDAAELREAVDALRAVDSAADRALFVAELRPSLDDTRWYDEAATRGDEAMAVAIGQSSTESLPAVIRALYHRFGASITRSFRARARAALATMTDARTAEQLAWVASLLLALEPEDARERAIELASAVQSVEDGELYFAEDESNDDLRIEALFALVHCGEIELALALFDRVLENPYPWNDEVNQEPSASLLAATRALGARLSAERLSEFEQKIIERFVRASPTLSVIARSIDAMRSPARDACAEQLASLVADPTVSAPPLALRVLSPSLREPIVRRALARFDEQLSPTNPVDDALASRALAALGADELAAREIAGRLSAIVTRFGPTSATAAGAASLLVAAARSSNPEALAALAEAIDRGLAVFASGDSALARLPDALLRRAVERGAHDRTPRRACAEVSGALALWLRSADQPERERVWPSIRALVDRDAIAIDELIALAPRSEFDATIARAIELVRSLRPCALLCRALAPSEQRQRFAARAIERFARDCLGDSSVEFALATALDDDPRALCWLSDRCGGEQAIGAASLPPRLLLARLRDARRDGGAWWWRVLPSWLLVAHVRHTDGGPSLLGQCAHDALSRHVGARPPEERPTSSEFTDFLRFAAPATIELASGQAAQLGSAWIAHELVVRASELSLEKALSPDVARAFAAKMLETFRELPGDSWMRALWSRVAGEAALPREPPKDAERSNVTLDTIACKLADEVLPWGGFLSTRAAGEFAATLWPHASLEARRAAFEWVVRAFRSQRVVGAQLPAEIVADLPLDALIDTWARHGSGSTRLAWMAHGAEIARVGGARAHREITDSIADALRRL